MQLTQNSSIQPEADFFFEQGQKTAIFFTKISQQSLGHIPTFSKVSLKLLEPGSHSSNQPQWLKSSSSPLFSMILLVWTIKAHLKCLTAFQIKSTHSSKQKHGQSYHSNILVLVQTSFLVQFSTTEKRQKTKTTLIKENFNWGWLTIYPIIILAAKLVLCSQTWSYRLSQ